MSNERGDDGTGPSGGVQSVDRAITALEIIARDGQAGVREVAAQLGVHKSTASRLLGALESRGLLEQTNDRGRYRLGSGILRLAGAIPGRLDLTSQGTQICAELAAEVGETVNLAVLQGQRAVNIHQIHGSSAITVNNWVGRPTPLHATSSGKVLLAGLPRAEREDLLGIDLERFTDDTVVDLGRLHTHLDQVSADGFAVTVGELEVGLNAIAAGVRSFGGALVGALSVSGPAYRLSPDVLQEISPAVVDAAARISQRMGFFEEHDRHL